MKKTINLIQALFVILLIYALSLSAKAQTQIGPDITPTEFVTSVSLSGDGSRIAVGNQFYDTPTLNNAGRIDVYDWNGSAWVQVGDPLIGDQDDKRLGGLTSLSDNGNFLLASRPRAAVPPLNSTPQGQIKVYVWTGTFWNTANNTAFSPGGQINSQFGFSFARADGPDRIIGGAPFWRDFSLAGRWHGYVGIYEFDPSFGYRLLLNQNNDWLSGTDDEGRYGISVDISDDGERFAIGTAAGYAEVQSFVPGNISPYFGTWVQIGSRLNPPNGGTCFGGTVKIAGTGNRLVVSDCFGGEKVYTYDYDGTDWQIRGPALSGSPVFRIVDITSDGNTLVTRESTTDPVSNVRSYHLRLWSRVGDNWVQLGNTISEPAMTNFRVSAAMSSDGSVAALDPGIDAVKVFDVTGLTVLPVELVEFRGEQAGKHNRLYWETSFEEDVKEFTLERSLDGGRTFLEIAKLPAANIPSGSTYSHTDEYPSTPNNHPIYYGLLVRDFDGSEERYGPIVITMGNAGFNELEVSPNPVASLGVINIQGAAAGAKLALTAVDGRRIGTLSPVSEGSYQLPGLRPGVYIVRSLEGRNKGEAARFVVR